MVDVKIELEWEVVSRHSEYPYLRKSIQVNGFLFHIIAIPVKSVNSRIHVLDADDEPQLEFICAELSSPPETFRHGDFDYCMVGTSAAQ